MPIYAYRCDTCGFAKDVLQKLSDVQLTTCPSCGAESFSKQVTAAGFQLKGSGWYVTDFRGGNTGAPPAAGGGAASSAQSTKSEGAVPAKTESGGDAQAASAAPAPAPAPAPAKTDKGT